MIKGFKDFLMRGNVIDLAVAVVVGAAFSAVVKSLTDSLIRPVLTVFGGVDAAGLGFQITDNKETFVDIGAVITAIIQFLITAAVVYFLVVVPLKKSQEMAKRRAKEKPAEEPAPADPTDVELLSEIRDLLRDSASAPQSAIRLSSGPQTLN
ncbi:MAG: large conductance mechanosensitive channel protein MscL [Candidatus Nanopelagicales bacterium]